MFHMERVLRTRMFFAVLVGSAVLRTTAERVSAQVEVNGLGESQFVSQEESQAELQDFQPAELEDITEPIAVADSTGSARCCCDAHQLGSHAHTRSHSSRSGACIFFPVVGRRHHCSDLGRHSRTWQTGKLHHFTRTEGQRCMIDRSESATVAQQLQRLHPTPDYCHEILPVTSLTAAHQGRHALVSVPATPLDGTAQVSCQAGFEPEELQVTCVIDTVGAGAFFPRPVCKRLANWCPDSHEENLRVVGAGVGQSRTVTCPEGMTPGAELVTCGRDGVFHPAPSCVANAHFDVTVRAAEVEASGRGRCCCDSDHRHFSSMSRWLTGDTEHTGACLFVFEVGHCREIEGRNHWVHYRRTQAGTCVVEEREYERLNDAYPPAQGWSHDAERIGR